MTRVLITGVAGQDGSYLAELLLAQGHEVHGTVRPGSTDAPAGVVLHEIDLALPGAGELLHTVEPEQVYNLAAVSSVFRSWREPELTARINGSLVAELLAAAKDVGARFVQASSGEIFGAPSISPQDESTLVRPTSPYGAAKAYAHHLVGVFREAGVFASSCILYNHESPRRPDTFVTRKITKAAARISLGLQERLELGNVDARRDWGWAPDYVRAMVLAGAADAPADFVIATGESHSVLDFARAAFAAAGVEDGESRIDVSGELLRAGDAPELVGDPSRARRVLDWAPTVDFDGIIRAMVRADIAAIGA